MRQLCFGGSFNPIHHGHLIVARAAAEAIGADIVRFIPTAQAPHKTDQADLLTTSAPARLAMCELAVMGNPGFIVDDIEMRRGGKSYTIDTVRSFKQQGHAEVNWLIGADMLDILPMWHESAALLKEVNFIILARPGWKFDFDSLGPAYATLSKNIVSTPMIQISSTDIRNRVKQGLSIDFLTPPAVCRYIAQNGLYR